MIVDTEYIQWLSNLKKLFRQSQWYQFYYEQIRIRQQAADELELPEKFAFVPLYHHVPTVGLIICKSTDKTVVEWSLKDICKPLGVATYQLEEVVERTVKGFELNNK